MKTHKEELKSGFDAIGKPIPSHRLNAAYKTVKDILPDVTTEKAMNIVGKAASFLEHDKPYSLLGETSTLDSDLNLIDLTGRYRLMAVLLNG